MAAPYKPIYQGNWDQLNAYLSGLSASSSPAYGTTLPASPSDGDEAVLVDSITNPTYQWLFRYNAGSSSAYKWEFVGGTQAAAAVAAQQVPGSASGWVDLATVGPSITLPRSGDYTVEAQVTLTLGAATLTNFFVGVFYNGTIQQGSDPYTLTASSQGAVMRWVFGNGVSSGANAGTIKLQYQASQIASGSPSFSDRAIFILPRRVA